MGEVVRLDDYRPHMAATHPGGDIHVAPAFFIEYLARCEGDIKGYDAELSRAIMWSWLIDNGYGE